MTNLRKIYIWLDFTWIRGETVDLIYDLGSLLTSPKTAFKIMAAEDRGVGYALATLVIFSLATSLSTISALSWIGRYLPAPLTSMIFLGGAILAAGALLVIDIIAWLLLSLIAWGFSHAFGGKGSFSGTLMIYAYSWVGRVFYVVPALIAALVANPVAMAGLLGIGLILEFIAKLVIQVRGLQVVHEISDGKALAAALLAVILLFLVMFAPATL